MRFNLFGQIQYHNYISKMQLKHRQHVIEHHFLEEGSVDLEQLMVDDYGDEYPVQPMFEVVFGNMVSFLQSKFLADKCTAKIIDQDVNVVVICGNDYIDITFLDLIEDGLMKNDLLTSCRVLNNKTGEVGSIKTDNGDFDEFVLENYL